MAACEVLDTDMIAVRSRIDRWNRFASETLAALSAETAAPEAFRATMKRREIGDLGIVRLTCPASTCRGLSGQVGPWAAPRRDAFVLLMPTSGECHIRQDGIEATLRPGDMMLSDTTKPWTTVCAGPIDAVLIKLPTERLMQRLGDLPSLAGMVRRRDEISARLTGDLLASIVDALDRFEDEPWDEGISDLILDAIALTFRAEAKPCSRQWDSLRREVQAHIERNLGNPLLSVALVASASGSSVRSVQRAFSDAGTTPRKYILDRRLAVAARALRQPSSAASVTEIAFAAGFNDLSYFIRCFSREFGATPTSYRRLKRGN